MKRFAVMGAGGCGRGVMPLLREQLSSTYVDEEIEISYIDDGINQSSVNGQKVYKYKEWLASPATSRYVSVAIANSVIRERLTNQCKLDGVSFLDIRASNVIVFDDVVISEGSIISPFVTLASNIKIGKHFHANLYSYVEHDCIIGDFVTFAPGVKCNGNVLIEDHVYIGAGAVIKQGLPGGPLRIGRGAVIGMGAVVTKSIAPNSVVVGNPARAIIKR